MKVKCIEIDPERFPVGEASKQSFRSQFGRGRARKIFDHVDIGATYVVYAIKTWSGHPFYYVRDRRLGWTHAPGLCFDIVDNRLSSLWRCGFRVRPGPNGEEDVLYTLAIREWVEEPDFLTNLVDGRDREVRIMEAATAFMDQELDG